MPGSSPQQSSFIPKRSNGAPKRQPRQNTFFILGIISYACLLAAPTSAAGVYVYKLYVEKQFQAAVNALNTEIDTFSQADMNTVLEFNTRLVVAKSLLENHLSLNRALAVLETNTAQSVGFKTVAMKREGAHEVSVSAEMVTDTLDAAMFQRKAYTGVAALATSTLEEVAFTPADEDGVGRTVSFKGVFGFHAKDVTFEPEGAATALVPTDSAPIATTTASTTDVSATNEPVL